MGSGECVECAGTLHSLWVVWVLCKGVGDVLVDLIQHSCDCFHSAVPPFVDTFIGYSDSLVVPRAVRARLEVLLRLGLGLELCALFVFVFDWHLEAKVFFGLAGRPATFDFATPRLSSWSLALPPASAFRRVQRRASLPAKCLLNLLDHRCFGSLLGVR